ncbi:alanyl-tRNA editing protein [Neobacillus terrae]|uniref:alanyl-tRNA editing protein n=1 Tax=Neobacillus terrae TaxID=3034837 RepID=UPI00140BA3A9|nr:DHHA1 domain-containing protein [Neobacillus terrae]NHM33763.1 alanyl-tRNA editing protein [Neobacillus terrae]
MKNKIYYEDAYRTNFTSKIIKSGQDEDGQYVVLEETAFYPTGGGQPYDIGTLNGVSVGSVEEKDGEIRHYVSGTLERGIDIQGEIDWEHRFDHMQQHSGQHILSAAFDNTFGYKTVSFHLGKEYLTIDLNIEQLPEEDAWRAEELANQIILENRPIETKWVSEDELSQYTLRKALKVTEDIRLVIIPDYDYNGCGGTHPRSTGEVAAIKILDWEKQKKNTRVRFVCGNRVRKQLSQKHKVLTELSPLLNASEENMAAAINRILTGTKTLEKELEAAKESLLQYEGAELLSENDGQVAELFANRPIQELQKLAKIMVSLNEDSRIILVAENDGKLQFVCAKGKNAEGIMKEWAAAAFPLINGKGGGNETFAQGGGEALVSAEELLQFLKENLEA